MMHLKILNANRQKFIEELDFTKKLGLYLAGGTALALQLGHRTSIDFDFYAPRHFQKNALSLSFKENLTDRTMKIIRDTDDNFEAVFDSDIETSCFYYPYKLLNPLTKVKGVDVASIEDIAAMKIVAISQRGKRRDFVDAYFLIKKFGLEKILKFTEKKFSQFDIYNGLRGLLYFDDADTDRDIRRFEIFKEDASWLEMKEFIKKEVFDFQKKQKKVKIS